MRVWCGGLNAKGEDLAVEGEDRGAAIFQIVTTLKTRACLLASVLCMYLNIPQNEAAFPLPKRKYKKKKNAQKPPRVNLRGRKEKGKRKKESKVNKYQSINKMFFCLGPASSRFIRQKSRGFQKYDLIW